LIETALVIESRFGDAGARELDLLLYRADIVIREVDAEQAAAARTAFARFGKGHHPARLNFGDLFSYALARVSGEPLLFKGDDFAQTDVTPVSFPPRP
jgi:ribonuclease VapC